MKPTKREVTREVKMLMWRDRPVIHEKTFVSP